MVAGARPGIEPLLREQVPLAPFTTLGVGGPARFVIEATDPDLVPRAIDWAAARQLPLFVLGGGSNIVVADSGFDGLVLRVAVKGLDTCEEGDRVTVSAGAGEEWDDLVSFSVERGWAGLECLSGIPGTVGGTPVQNVGAYGQEVGETIASVAAVDRATGQVVDIDRSACEFGYRASRFKGRDRDRFVITGVRYHLRPNGRPTIIYPDVRSYLARCGPQAPSIADVRAAVIAIRRRKGMIVDPQDADSRSVGSFFVNPLVTRDELDRLLRTRARTPDTVPAFPAAGGFFKLSAAWLIEAAGFPRGYAAGNVGLSTRHAMAIVNRGGATAAEVVGLAAEIVARVGDLFDVELRPEPVFVGFDPGTLPWSRE